jgi:hypothetical protein
VFTPGGWDAEGVSGAIINISTNVVVRVKRQETYIYIHIHIHECTDTYIAYTPIVLVRVATYITYRASGLVLVTELFILKME